MPTTFRPQDPREPSRCTCGCGSPEECGGRYPVLPADVHAAVTGMAGKGMPFARIAEQTGLSLHDVRRVVLDWAQREAAAAQPRRARRDHRGTAGEAPAYKPPETPRELRDRAAAWLRFAGVAVGLVAVAAAAVSYEAQWRLVYRDKHELGVSYIQAAIPDLGSLVFACFGIALALHGKRAIRARLLNVLCVGISIAMNVLAATGGWQGLAVWVMSPVIYALASDTLIGVVRAYVIARQKRLHEALADDGVTPLQIVGAVLLWLLRLVWAPPSTLKGFHRWVKSLPAAPPVRQQVLPNLRPAVKGPKRERPAIPNSRGPRTGTKQEQFLTLVIARYGPLTGFDITAVSRAAAELAPEAQLHPGTARKILRAQVLAAQNGDPR
jgi:hypothetical protein